MAYADEEILVKREQAKMETYTTLEKGIYMDGEIIHFKRKELFDAFSIMLPELWKQMPKEYARIKYPSEFRPQNYHIRQYILHLMEQAGIVCLK